MTAHSCTTFNPGCFRCDLSRDEVAVRRSPLWAIEHSRLLNHAATETGCEDCAAVPPMHEAIDAPETREIAFSRSNRRSVDLGDSESGAEA